MSLLKVLNGGMDEKWKKLEDKDKDLDELSTNLGLYIRDDYQIFHSLGEIVEDVKRGRKRDGKKFVSSIRLESVFKRNRIRN